MNSVAREETSTAFLIGKLPEKKEMEGVFKTIEEGKNKLLKEST